MLSRCLYSIAIVVYAFVGEVCCECICGYISGPSPDLCYKLKAAHVTGSEARTQCQEDGGDLALVLDLSIASWVFVYILSTDNLITPWTGVQYDDKKKNWTYMGEKLIYNITDSVTIILESEPSEQYTVLNTTTMTLSTRAQSERYPCLCVMESSNISTATTITEYITAQLTMSQDVVSVYHTVTEVVTVTPSNIPTSSGSVILDAGCLQHNQSASYGTLNLEMKLKAIAEDLTLSKTALSSVKRKYSSAPDGRKTSYVMGSTAAFIIVFPLIVVFFTDIPNFIRSVKPKKVVRIRKIKVKSTTC